MSNKPKTKAEERENFTFRMTPSLKRQVRMRAVIEGRSISDLMEDATKDYLSKFGTPVAC